MLPPDPVPAPTNPPAKPTRAKPGFIDRELLERTLPPDCRTYEFFICGPVPMMNAVERALDQLGVSVMDVHSERFDMV